MQKVLSKMNLEELEEFCLSIEESRFRARQIYNWVYLKSVGSVDEMTDLSKKFRERLKGLAIVSDIKIVKKQVSADGTVKFLLEYPDKERVETVLMRFDNRSNLTACVSSQVGCAMGCAFCATGKRGFIRNLTPYEIIEQVLAIQTETRLKVTNIVFIVNRESKPKYINMAYPPNIVIDIAHKKPNTPVVIANIITCISGAINPISSAIILIPLLRIINSY